MQTCTTNETAGYQATIERILPKLIAEQTKLQIREAAIKRSIKKLRVLLPTLDSSADFELAEGTLLQHEALLFELKEYREDVAIDLKKMADALETGKELEDEKGKRALFAYVADDAERSLENFTNAKNQYMDIFDRLHELAGLWL